MRPIFAVILLGGAPVLFGNPAALAAGDEPPRSLDPRVKITLFAEAPQIVTPTGLDVDAQGRVWALESNTHFPPAGYDRHPTDRLWVMSDADADGRADKCSVFTDDITHAMSVAVRPDGSVYVATRKTILRLHDDNTDLQADRSETIAHLETTADYPHNGLAGFAFDALGWMYFGLGENFGAKYDLVGSDGIRLTGGGEGGNVFRMRPDGTRLVRLATGFWNPHASCVDAFGRLFTVDNDADSRPPCRLLHIVPNGDYGYRFRNGRKGLHPFTAWDGELPGTLPMVAGTGEAPSGIVAYESDGLPAEYVGTLLGTSWGDHRIERFRLSPRGVSFVSQAEPIVVGGEHFRPVGLAIAPDGSLYCTDWVLKDYEVHSQGRIWRISAVDEPQGTPLDVRDLTPRKPVESLEALLDSPRMDVRRAAAGALAATRLGRDRLRTVLRETERPLRARSDAFFSLAARDPDAAFDDLNRTRVPDARSVRDTSLADANELSTAALWAAASEEKKTARAAVHARRAADLYTDWLDKDRPPAKDPVASLAALAACRFDLGTAPLAKLLAPRDPFLFGMTVNVLSRTDDEETVAMLLAPRVTADARTRLGLVLAARLNNPKSAKIAAIALEDPDPVVLRAAVQWAGEERLDSLRARVEQILASGAVTAELFEAALATLELLDGVDRKPSDEWSGAEYVLKLVGDGTKAAEARARALRMLPPHHPALDEAFFRGLLSSSDEGLRLESVRTLALSPLAAAPAMLRELACDETNAVAIRAEAIAGLSAAVAVPATRQDVEPVLIDLLASTERDLCLEAIRALAPLAATDSEAAAGLRRCAAALVADATAKTGPEPAIADEAELLAIALALTGPAELEALRPRRPADTEGWTATVGEGGDPERGRRVFFHAGAGCHRCHRIDGRGGSIGPDLSVIAKSADRRKLAESILDPSREIAPQFATWSFVLQSGKVENGVILAEDRSGIVRVGTADGVIVEIPAADIETRVAQKTSLMPDKLVDRMTVAELRDVLAYLETLR